jgi:hypothetical protein
MAVMALGLALANSTVDLRLLGYDYRKYKKAVASTC